MELDPESVLVVDDDELVCESVAMVLSGAGYRTMTAGTGAEAIDLGRSVRPSLVLVDFDLPDVNGREVARTLRRSVVDLRIILSSGYQIDDVAEFDDVLLKPFSARDLLLRVAHSLRLQ